MTLQSCSLTTTHQLCYVHPLNNTQQYIFFIGFSIEKQYAHKKDMRDRRKDEELVTK